MQRSTSKQVLFLFVMALSIFILMGLFLATNAHSKTRLRSMVDWDWDDDFGDISRSVFDFRYNRVEGLFLGVKMKKEDGRWYSSNRPLLYGSAGYAFAAKEFEYQVGIEKGFFDRFRLGFGGEYHRNIDTADRWVISDLENSLAAVLIKEDFHDFYLKEGWSAYITQNLGRDFQLSVGYHSDELDSLEKNEKWALFGGDKKFPENPAMPAGIMRSIVSRLLLDTRNSRRDVTRGWYLEAVLENAGGSLGGDFGFKKLLFDLRRFQPLGFGEGFDFRIRVGTSQGDLPWHKSYHLGGLSTLRGFPYKAFPNGRFNAGGNRMILAQIEYRMGIQDLPDELDWGILELFNLIVFFDAGWVGIADGDASYFKGFGGLTWNSLKTDLGIALANRNGSVRFEVARRTDTGKKPYTFAFRISRPF